jgi:hypothetical protein
MILPIYPMNKLPVKRLPLFAEDPFNAFSMER